MKHRINLQKYILKIFIVLLTLYNYSCEISDNRIPYYNTEAVINQTEPEFSSDGNKIVFGGFYDNIYAIHFIDNQGNYLGHILDSVNDFHYIGRPTWASDNSILISIDGRVHTVKFNGDSLTPLPLKDWIYYCKLSPDGKYIAYKKSDNQYSGIVFNDLGNNTTKLAGFYGENPIWNRDSDKIYYYQNIYNVRYPTQFEGFEFNIVDIYTFRVKVLFYVSDPDLRVQDWTISPDEKSILFSSREGFPSHINLWKINLPDSTVERFLQDAHSPDYSPDGKNIVYTNTSRSEGGLWIMNSDGSDNKRLTLLNK